MTLGGLDGTGLHYQVRYAKHLASDRLLTALSVGYFQKNWRDHIAPDSYSTLTIDGDKLRRISLDLSILVDLLPAPHHALRVGGGLSYWYRSDNLVTGGSSKWSSDKGVYDIQQSRVSEQAWNLGYHLTLEYEKRLTRQLAVTGKVGWANFTRDRLLSTSNNNWGTITPVFQSAQASLGINYLF